ncbi:SusC/RagA family TonB-linked outer membrane protein [Marseilla massiliensis]|uniref:TonB-dependent receptor n=1 Tax=Marseilla massiliensis TaxID=1841864 RepID=A0A938WRY2_9BACT|nr:TonB-dependent receptor [Marseilla massiliensis]MBM6673049.1 TonB-dependent receptor [Marseilla massiliensis]
MKRKFIISLCFGVMAFAASPVLAQNTDIRGTVVDEHGEPIIGASVRVEGQDGGVITDLDGNYVIKAPKGAKVTITYIGYEPMTVTGGGRVQLKEDSQNLGELVVVGYGVQKKAHLTGSVATVPVDEIQDLASGDLASTLEGLVNGLSISGGNSRPGESASMYVRGTSSLSDIGSTAQQPLFVIDGYIYPNDVKVGNASQNLGAEAFNNLDPAEVESITVLKDASAAVYGARAANGVILVTTKKGKIGAPRISYSGTFGFTDAVSHPKMLSAYEYGRLYNAVAAADPTDTNLNHLTGLYQADELEAMKGLNYDLLDKYWETGFTMKHSVNLSGATEKASYFANLSYFDQGANLGNLDYNRWNFRAGVDVKVSKWLSANLNVSGDYGKKNTPYIKIGGSSNEKDYNILLTRPRYIPEYVNGLPIAAYGISNSEVDEDQNYSFSELRNNGDYSRSMTSNLNIQAGVNYDFGWSKILKGLTLRFTYSKSINTDKTNQFGSSFDVYTMLNRTGSGQHLYTPVAGENYDDYLTDSNLQKMTISNGTAQLNRSMVRTDNYQMNFTAAYNRDFGLHSVGALFSIEKSEAESEYLYGQRNDPYSFTNGQSNGADGDIDMNFKRFESGTLSYIGRFNYAYANKYLFEFLIRSDASTKFAPENYWGVFPSFSAGWVMSEENWFKKALPWVDFLKLRGSFGLTGRDNIVAWQWMQLYASDANKGPVFGTGASNDTSNILSLNKNNSAVNPDVHWDKVYKANFGIDLNVLNNRLSVTFDMFREWNREMLMTISQSIEATIGTQSASTNLGEMDNWGYELSVTWRDKIGKDFKYRIGLNTGYYDNKVLNMDWETEYIYRQIQKGGRTDIGLWGLQCIGMFRSFQDIEEYFDKYNITSYLGMSKDEVRPGMLIYKDVRGPQQADGTYAEPDGVVDEDNDQVRLSNRTNPYSFTLNLGADWKGLSLTAQINAQWGGYDVLDGSMLKSGSGVDDLEFTSMPIFWNVDNMYSYQDVYDAQGNLVVAANRNGSLPNLAYQSVNSIASSFWRISATRVTLNRLTLAYTLPQAWVKKVGLQNVRFNVTGQNLLSFYNPYPDNFIDPMCSYGAYPTLRKFTVGVNVTF